MVSFFIWHSTQPALITIIIIIKCVSHGLGIILPIRWYSVIYQRKNMWRKASKKRKRVRNSLFCYLFIFFSFAFTESIICRYVFICSYKIEFWLFWILIWHSWIMYYIYMGCVFLLCIRIYVSCGKEIPIWNWLRVVCFCAGVITEP